MHLVECYESLDKADCQCSGNAGAHVRLRFPGPPRGPPQVVLGLQPLGWQGRPSALDSRVSWLEESLWWSPRHECQRCTGRLTEREIGRFSKSLCCFCWWLYTWMYKYIDRCYKSVFIHFIHTTKQLCFWTDQELPSLRIALVRMRLCCARQNGLLATAVGIV